MKKVLALALALIMALSMSAMAFAADETAASGDVNVNVNINIPATEATEATEAEDDAATLDVVSILNMIIDLVKSSMTQWDDIESIVVRLVDFLENIGSAVVGKADVEGAVADLEAALADVEIPGLSDLLNTLKAKIKAMYAGEVATTVEVTTEAEAKPDTGSSSVGIAVFAAVSVAAAAAYVCTKKSK